MSDLPSQIGRYQILGLLGTGGMAEVFLGRLVGPSGFERPVVIKRILPHLAREQHFRDMFLDEARIVAGIRHQNVVHVQELCQEDGELFMVMEYLEGESAAGLARRLSSKRKLLSFGLAAHIVAETCHGLHAAHELTDARGRPQNLVHRDVSPANVFVTYGGEVKILDFGIAVAADRVSRTEAGQVKGKYAYMSPEQCKGKALDRRSDVFSLGTVLYEISTCRRLFKRDSDMLTLQAICSEEVMPPSKLVSSYPASLEAVVMKALSRNREERYQTALELRRDLLEVSRELNESKVPDESLSRVMKKLFADRVQQKHQLRTRIRAGRNVSQVPNAETDPSVELPAAAFAEDLSPMSSVSMADRSTPTTRPSRRGWYAAAAAAVVLLLVGTAAFTVGRSGADLSAAAEEPRPATPAAEAPAPTAPARPANVVVTLHSQPPGARVYVDGRPRGETPLALELPRADAPVELTLRLRGHTPLVERVVPDMNQKLRLVLAEAPTVAQDVRRPAAPAVEEPARPATVSSPPAARPAREPKVRAKAKAAPPADAPNSDPYEKLDDPYKRFD